MDNPLCMCSKKYLSDISNGQLKSKHALNWISKANSANSISRTNFSNGPNYSLKQQKNSPVMNLTTSKVSIGSFNTKRTALEDNFFCEKLQKDIGILKDDFLGFREHLTSMWSNLKGLQEQTTQVKREVNDRGLCLENLEAELKLTTEVVFHFKDKLDYLVNYQDYSHESLQESLRVVQYEIVKLCHEHSKIHDCFRVSRSRHSEYESSAENWFDESKRYIQDTQLSISTLTKQRICQDTHKSNTLGHSHHNIKAQYTLSSPIDATNPPLSKNTLISPLEGLLRYYLNATRGLIDIVKLSSYPKLKEQVGVLHSCTL